MTTIGEFIRERRLALDLTKSEAAQRAGVARRTWHDIEDDKRTATELTLRQFDQALQLPEGTLWAMTAQSANQQIEALRQRAVTIVYGMTTGRLQEFVETSGGVDSLRAELQAIRATVEELRSMFGDPPSGSSVRRPAAAHRRGLESAR